MRRQFITVPRIRLGAPGAALPAAPGPVVVPIVNVVPIAPAPTNRVTIALPTEQLELPRTNISLDEITRFDNNHYYNSLLSEAVNLHLSSVKIQSYLVVYQEVNKVSTEYQDLLARLFYKKTEVKFRYGLMDEDNIFRVLRDQLVAQPLFKQLGIGTISSIEVGDFNQQLVLINRILLFSIFDAHREKRVARVTYFSSTPTSEAERRANIQSSTRQRVVEGESLQFKTFLTESPEGARVLSILDFVIQKFPYTFIELIEENEQQPE